MEKHYKIRLPPQQVQLQSIYWCLTIWALKCRHLEFLSIADREWDRDVPALVRDAARSTVQDPVALRWQGQLLCHCSDRKLAGGCTESCPTWASLSFEVFVPVVKNLSTASSPPPSASPKDVLQPQLDCSLWEQLIQASLRLLSVTFVTKIWGTGI